MVHPRIAAPRLLALLRQFPAVSILGARQTGKSTLARWALPDYEYLDLEDPQHLARLERDPAWVLGQSSRWIIDEAQRLPALFPLLRSAIDQRPRDRFVLLGSASPSLWRGVSESLAGRVGLLDLGGISVLEAEPEALWVKGGFPRVHWSRPRARPEDWYPAYLRTCLERDVPQLGFRLPAGRLRNLLIMIAHGQGGVTNLSELGASLGVSYHTVAAALDVLEGVFLVRRLPPYFANLGKRLVKSPKLYVRDTGLLHTLLGIPCERRALLAHPKVGASFETFCLEQLQLHAALADPQAEAFFFRTHSGVEADLVLRLRGELVPIEVKLGTSLPNTRALETVMGDLGARRGFVVSSRQGSEDIGRSVVFGGLTEILRQLALVPRAPPRRQRARAGR